MANLITLSRFPLLVAIVVLLYVPSPALRLVTVGLLVVLILLDTMDGVVARARHEESALGSLLDIMTDRAVELVLWVCYAHLGLIPVAIPIIYIVRGTVVDSLRNVHVGQGTAPFKIMRTPIGRWLVGSPAMRTSYAVSKLLSFTGLALTNALVAYAAQGAISVGEVQISQTISTALSWISVLFCLVRGIPVVLEALPVLRPGEPPQV
jgi:CDP-diacylglycerol--glycerol-3-phosphate 3-phosphatidyltransferase